MIVRGAVLREMGLPSPYAESRPLTIEELHLAPPGPGELLVRIRAAGLCHSDLSVINGSRPRVMPMLLGHEATGEVIQSEAANFAPGDTVGFAFVPACGACAPCAEGRAALCEPGAAANATGTLLSGERRLTIPPTSDLPPASDQPSPSDRPPAAGTSLASEVHHHLGVSGFADYAVVSARSAVRIDPSLPPEIAALFGCAVMTGVGAVVNTARVQAGQSAVVFGLGGVGLSALLGAVLVGAHPIVAVDVVPEKLSLALELGATHAIDARGNDVAEQVREATDGGAHYAFETVGSAAVLGQAYAATRRGGTTVTVGLPDPSQLLSIPAVSLVAEERTLKGSYLGSAIPSRDIPRYIALYQAGRLPVDRLLTSTVRLESLNEAFDTLATGTSIRQVLVL
ncbi:zinc-dependent alcohol dehydrogenase family protein [Streptomyces sp. SID13031]|uniref:zinc-dependent alcohol dehydrogenase family protein n=1 Tax=Streptomyces sp. SID13031 TaxID=2706046 RepID=UPI0013C8138B|nr:zinc-dependent alcohol dehydrogenase family protein [Streptomyces sp. SID13031]NEA36349.1 zinc-binding dehydrogenase [Streptomyces sp. SID13031]